MVFGSTYCPISHLEIADGDNCILIPLGFRMQHNFDSSNKADINCFAFLHVFISEPIEVKFGGNVAAVEYLTDRHHYKAGQVYEEHEMFMLIHKGFYETLIAEMDMFDTIERLSLYNTVWLIWEKAHKIVEDERCAKLAQWANGKITRDECFKDAMNHPTPEWIKNIYKVADFMGKMGIAPHPVWCNDQHETWKDYEKWRAPFVKTQCDLPNYYLRYKGIRYPAKLAGTPEGKIQLVYCNHEAAISNHVSKTKDNEHLFTSEMKSHFLSKKELKQLKDGELDTINFIGR